jgi:hypothetical protein
MKESSFREKTAAAKKLFGTAAKLAQKQAELATLNNVTLPKLYHAIGKRIVGSDKLPADLEHHRQKIRQLESGIAATPEEIKSDPAGGFAAKAKQFAQQAAQKAAKATGDATATVQIQAAYVALGKEAVEKYGDKAVPAEMRSDLSAAVARRADLEFCIAELMTTTSVRFSRPPRLAMIGMILFFISWLLPTTGLASLSGWGAFCHLLIGTPWIAKVAPLTNVIACVSIALLCGWHRKSLSAIRLMQVLLVLCILWNSLYLSSQPRIGYFAWQASFVLFFLAMRTQARLIVQSAEGTDSLAVRSPRWAVVQVITATVFVVLCISTLLNLGTRARVAADIATGSVATSSSQALPPPPASGSSNDRNANVDAAQMILNAMFTAAAFRAAEEQRLQQQQVRQQPPPDYSQRPSAPAPMPPLPAGGDPGPSIREPSRRQFTPRQRFEGTCTRCGWRTGDQNNKDTRTCPMVTKTDGGFGVGTCGGVIVWAPSKSW